MAAAIGLIIGGVSSCAAWQTARDTREALEIDLQRHKAEQASLVTTWVEYETLTPKSDKSVELHVRNRSLDPIPQWFVAYSQQDLQGDYRGSQILESFNLPPCSELIIKANHAFHALDWRSQGKSESFDAFQFWDASGSLWTRNDRGILKSGDGYSNAHQDTLTSIYTYEELVAHGVKVRTLKECGDSR
jgi:hypothetical protein